MKIIVLADLHIPAAAEDLPRQVYDAFKGADMIIVAGDIVEEDVFAKLKKICPDIIAVSGNMDSEEIKRKLPEKQVISVKNFTIGIMHGYGPPDKLEDIVKETFKDDGVDMVIFGHSHRPINRKRGGILYFNPGSPTEKVFAPFNSYGIVEINDTIRAEIVKIE